VFCQRPNDLRSDLSSKRLDVEHAYNVSCANDDWQLQDSQGSAAAPLSLSLSLSFFKAVDPLNLKPFQRVRAARSGSALNRTLVKANGKLASRAA